MPIIVISGGHAEGRIVYFMDLDMVLLVERYAPSSRAMLINHHMKRYSPLKEQIQMCTMKWFEHTLVQLAFFLPVMEIRFFSPLVLQFTTDTFVVILQVASICSLYSIQTMQSTTNCCLYMLCVCLIEFCYHPPLQWNC